MFRNPLLVLGLAALAAVGCKCSCAPSTEVVRDGGGGGGGAGGGAGGAGGGAGGGGTNWDGGDGTQTTTIGPGQFTLDGGAGGTGDGVKLDPNGHVVLNTGSIEFHFMWIANNSQGWVSKYDTKTGREVGRYYTAVPVDGLGQANGLRALPSNNPSRTAIDLYGDVWVANRAIGLQGSVTKIANDVSSCVDRNKDGAIRTSRDVNGDGAIDPDPGKGELILPNNMSDPLEYDECVLFSTPVGGPGGGVAARAIAISQGAEGTAGDVWVGIYRESRVYKLSALNGKVVPVNAAGDGSIYLSHWAPAGAYGAVVDGKQRLWLVYPGQARLALIDTATGTLIKDGNGNPLDITPQGGQACGSYSIGVDGKDRVWLPGWTAGTVACRYEHGPGLTNSIGSWTSFTYASAACDTSAGLGRPRGIAADDQGTIFMSSDTGAKLIKFDAETGAVKQFQTPTGPVDCVDATDGQTSGSIGVGLDSDGNPWVNNWSGNAMRIEKSSGAVLRTPQQAAGLYTYSDFTGYQLRKFTAPRGTYRKDMMGCGPDTEWRQVVWDAVTPPNTAVQVFVKVGATPADLANTATQRFGPFTTSPADLKAAGVPKAAYLRVEFVLSSSDGKNTPVLKSFNVVWGCQSTIG
ncbi:MAG: hypothetical protein HYZ28_27010 [Myxococcales bacterium]|nr:hypothetical protein [Myxococcales bacterium]